MILSKGGGAGYFGKRKSREKWSEKQKSFQNQRQPTAKIGALPVENFIVIHCFSQVLHYLTDLIRYFAIFRQNMHYLTMISELVVC